MRLAVGFACVVLGSTVEAQSVDEELRTVLGEYERVRDALANDRGAPVERAAVRMAAAATRAAAIASGTLQSKLRLLASKCRALASTDAADMPALRRAFGRVSEPLVGIVRASPSLRHGLHLFDCPMAEGYGGWIQNDEQIANPYMGQRMLTCGAGRDW